MQACGEMQPTSAVARQARHNLL